ncbi:MAG: hypothetical protein IPP33_03805 [Flavobacteriales bacterium]|nr:hypothetical protein [Flavobacteriales bacterium]
MDSKRAFDRSASAPLSYYALAVYMVLAVLFSAERMLNSDCSLQLYRSINDETFFFQEGRYGMFITQLPMLVGVWLQLPMKAIILLYSLGLAGTYGACVLVAHHVFKSPVGALAIIMSLVVGVGDSFFHSTTETHMLLAMSGLLFASLEWLAGCQVRIRAYPIVAAIAVWCLFIHPNALFTIGFVVLLNVLSKQIRWWEGAGILALCGVYFCGRLLLLHQDSYDAHQFDELMDFATHLNGFWGLFPIWFIKQYLENEYAAVVLLLLLVVLFYRPLLRMLLVLVSVSVFWFLTILTFHDGGGEAMMEKSFMPGIFMLCVPFAILVHRHRWHGFFVAITVLVLAHAFTNICMHRRYYGQRLDTLAVLIQDHGREAPKMLIPWEEAKGTVLHFSEWATSMDALMLSRCLGDTARTIFLDQEVAQDAVREPEAFLFLPWQRTETLPMNLYYFNLPHMPYRIVHVRLPKRIARFNED